MNGVFISYRREDTEGFARSLFQSLVAHFGKDQLFMDVEGIELGLDFVEAIDKSLSACGVLLVLIGKDWVTGVDAGGQRRLDNPEDFVRLEVAKALERNIRVIPILVRGTAMPDPQDLPDDLKLLTRRQALELRHDHWDSDVSLLIGALEKALGLTPKRTEPSGQTAARQAGPVAAAPAAKAKSRWKLPMLLAGFVLVAVSIALFIPDAEQPEPVQTWSAEPPPPTTYAAKESVPPKAPREPFVSVPEPPPAPPPLPEFSATMVFEAQELLAQLGYEPGPVDGQIGARTNRAVYAFQRDNRLPTTGQITVELIDALYAALEQRQGMAFPPPEPYYQPSVNMGGIWYDQEGFRYSIVHEGNQIRFQAFDMFGTPVAMGEGRLDGLRVDYVSVGIDGSQGRGQGMLSEDGRQMQYTVVNLMTGMQVSGWIRRE